MHGHACCTPAAHIAVGLGVRMGHVGAHGWPSTCRWGCAGGALQVASVALLTMLRHATASHSRPPPPVDPPPSFCPAAHSPASQQPPPRSGARGAPMQTRRPSARPRQPGDAAAPIRRRAESWHLPIRPPKQGEARARRGTSSTPLPCAPAPPCRVPSPPHQRSGRARRARPPARPPPARRTWGHPPRRPRVQTHDWPLTARPRACFWTCRAPWSRPSCPQSPGHREPATDISRTAAKETGK